MCNKLSISFAQALMPVESPLHSEQLGIQPGTDRVHLDIHLPDMQGLPREFEHHVNKTNGLFLSNIRVEHMFSVRLDTHQVIPLDAL